MLKPSLHLVQGCAGPQEEGFLDLPEKVCRDPVQGTSRFRADYPGSRKRNPIRSHLHEITRLPAEYVLPQ